MEVDKREEHESNSVGHTVDDAQRVPKYKELAVLRRQRSFKRAPVTRICKSVEDEISRQADRNSIEEANTRLKEALSDFRKTHELYESCVGDEEVNEAQAYTDRLEEECSIRWTVQYAAVSTATRRVLLIDRRLSSKLQKSRKVTNHSDVDRLEKYNEAEAELDDADSK